MYLPFVFWPVGDGKLIFFLPFHVLNLQWGGGVHLVFMGKGHLGITVESDPVSIFCPLGRKQ